MPENNFILKNKNMIWLNKPEEYYVDSNSLMIKALSGSNLFTSPSGNMKAFNLPMYLFKENGDFQLAAKMEVGFNSTFDAGCLMCYQNENYWAKLCFEYSPQKEPMVVSVVNNNISDDCNHIIIKSNYIYLRISSFNKALAFHYSYDGSFWFLARHFNLIEREDLMIGFGAQCPNGQICEVRFNEIKYDNIAIANLRNGN